MSSTCPSLVAWLTAIALILLVPAAGQCGDPVPLLTTQSDSGELAGWQSFHEDPGATTKDVWTVADDGILICSGDPKGCLHTEQEYTDFVLRLQWRWPPGKKPGKGGVLVRATGRHKLWPKSLEAQINAGDAGDFWGLDGYPLDGPAARKQTLESDQFGTLTHLKKTAAVEKPPGQWNQYEITARGGTVTLVINGQKVNEATACAVVAGKICLTAEGDEIHFRNLTLTPITESR